MSDEAFTINVKGLDKLVKALKGKLPQARVGIINDAPRAGGKEPSNAQIGVWHEFGNAKVPARSWLRVPLIDNLNKRLESSGALDKDVLAEVIAGGSIVPWIKKVAILAEGIVLEAFDTGGFGKWKPSDMRNKKVHQTLVETQQLRNSVTSEVKE